MAPDADDSSREESRCPEKLPGNCEAWFWNAVASCAIT